MAKKYAPKYRVTVAGATQWTRKNGRPDTDSWDTYTEAREAQDKIAADWQKSIDTGWIAQMPVFVIEYF